MWLLLLFSFSLGMDGSCSTDDDDSSVSDNMSVCSGDTFYTAQSADWDASSELSGAPTFYSLATTATSLGAATYGSKPTSACSGMSKFSQFSEDDFTTYQPTADDIQRLIIERDGSSSSYRIDRRKPELYAIHVQSLWVNGYQQPQRVTLIKANGVVVLDDLVRTEHYDKNVVQAYRLKNRERLSREMGVRMKDVEKFSDEDRQVMAEFILYGRESTNVINTFVQIYGKPLTRVWPAERNAPASNIRSFIKAYIGAASAFVVGFNATADLKLIISPEFQNSAFDINKLYPREGPQEEEYANLESGMRSGFAPDAVENARAALYFMLRKMKENCALVARSKPNHRRGHRTESHPRDWRPMYQNNFCTVDEDAEYIPACAFLDSGHIHNRFAFNHVRFRKMWAEEERRRKAFTLSSVSSDQKKTQAAKVMSLTERRQMERKLKEKEEMDTKALEQKNERQRWIADLDRQWRTKKSEQDKRTRATAKAQSILAPIYLEAYRRYDLFR